MDNADLVERDIPSKSNGRIVLSERDYAQFVAMLDNPEPPTPELREAMAEYQRLKAAYPEANL